MDAAQTKALLSAAMNARWQRPLREWLEEEGFDVEAFNERFAAFGEAAHPVPPELPATLAIMSASFTMGWEARKLVEAQNMIDPRLATLAIHGMHGPDAETALAALDERLLTHDLVHHFGQDAVRALLILAGPRALRPIDEGSPHAEPYDVPADPEPDVLDDEAIAREVALRTRPERPEILHDESPFPAPMLESTEWGPYG